MWNVSKNRQNSRCTGYGRVTTLENPNKGPQTSGIHRRSGQFVNGQACCEGRWRKICRSAEKAKKTAKAHDAVCPYKTTHCEGGLIDDENPPTQDRMAKDLGVSRGTVQNILKFNIDGKIVKKRKVHTLTVKQAEQRYVRGKKFLNISRLANCHFCWRWTRGWSPLKK